MTIIIDKEAFRHYAPKELHPHLRQFDAYLVQKGVQDQRVRKIIENPFAFFSAESFFPVIHVIALLKDGTWNYFSASLDRYKRKEGHRLVSEDENQNPQSMQPWLRLEVVSDPNLTSVFDKSVALRALAKGGDTLDPEDLKVYSELAKTAKAPAVLFTAPLVLMKKGVAEKLMRQRFTLYQHIFGSGHEYPDDGMFYVGITARDWKKRWSEHRAAINRGSPLKFHRVYRERTVQGRLTYVHHKVMGVAPSLLEIQDLEEAFVAAHWDDDRLLNMIPGGRAGIAYLHEHGRIAKNAIPTPDNVERVLEAWLREHPRKGLPAPWVSKNWKDDSYALKVICGPEGRLSIEQVFAIRSLAAGGASAEQIATQVGARNIQQVQRVIERKTYVRVPESRD